MKLNRGDPGNLGNQADEAEPGTSRKFRSLNRENPGNFGNQHTADEAEPRRDPGNFGNQLKADEAEPGRSRKI